MHPNGCSISYLRHSTGLLRRGGSTYNKGIVCITEVFVRLRSFVDLLSCWEHVEQWGWWLGNNINRFPWVVEYISFLYHWVGGFFLQGGVLVLRCWTFLDLAPMGSVMVCWFGMVVFEQLFFNIPWHRDVQCSIVVVPVQCDVTIQAACFVNCYFVVFLSAVTRWSKCSSPLYFTPKSSTTNVNWIGLLSCFHRLGVWGTS